MSNATPTGKEAMQGEWTCGAKFICLKTGADPLKEDSYKKVAQRPKGMSEEEWGDYADRIVDALNSERELIGELVGVLEQALDSRAPDYINTAHPSWSIKARLLIVKSQSHPAIGGK